jgi:CheY-like chemotaxis protein
VVDDEVALTRTLDRILAPTCDVVVMNHGRDALALLSENPTPGFDVVLCDLMMPEITGEEVYTEVTRRWPDLARRFVFMTGGAFTPRGRRFLESVSAPVLEKPFDASQVRALVTERAAGSSRG